MLHEPNIGAIYVVNYNLVILGLFDYASPLSLQRCYFIIPCGWWLVAKNLLCKMVSHVNSLDGIDDCR